MSLTPSDTQLRAWRCLSALRCCIACCKCTAMRRKRAFAWEVCLCLTHALQHAHRHPQAAEGDRDLQKLNKGRA